MDDLKLLLERQENCKARLIESRQVTRRYNDGRLDRFIYTFKLEDHAKASRAFVWQKEDTVGTREPTYVVVLAIPPITSPEAALDDAVEKIYRSLYQDL